MENLNYKNTPLNDKIDNTDFFIEPAWGEMEKLLGNETSNPTSTHGWRGKILLSVALLAIVAFWIAFWTAAKIASKNTSKEAATTDKKVAETNKISPKSTNLSFSNPTILDKTAEKKQPLEPDKNGQIITNPLVQPSSAANNFVHRNAAKKIFLMNKIANETNKNSEKIVNDIGGNQVNAGKLPTKSVDFAEKKLEDAQNYPQIKIDSSYPKNRNRILEITDVAILNPQNTDSEGNEKETTGRIPQNIAALPLDSVKLLDTPPVTMGKTTDTESGTICYSVTRIPKHYLEIGLGKADLNIYNTLAAGVVNNFRLSYHRRLTPLFGLGLSSNYFTQKRTYGYTWFLATNVEADLYFVNRRRFNFIISAGYGYKRWNMVQEPNKIQHGKGFNLGLVTRYNIKNNWILGGRIDLREPTPNNLENAVSLTLGKKF